VNPPPAFKFVLYVAGDAQNSAEAQANLRDLCHTHLPGRHEIEVVDVFVDGKRALADGVLMTPVLVKVTPLPLRKIVGTLSQRDKVLLALGLPAVLP
jgi:circadian clock protein KaiB